MKTLRFLIRDKQITRQDRNAVVAGAVNHYELNISFDDDWDGLTKTVVLENGDVKVELLYTGGMVLPWEVCKEGGLLLSVRGTKTLADGRTQVVRSARMAKPIPVEPGGSEEGQAPSGFTPELAEQVLAVLGDLAALLTTNKSTMVAAINEIYQEAGIESIRFKETDSDGNNVYTVNLSRGERYEIKAPIGPRGAQGEQGVPGEAIELRYDKEQTMLQWKLPSSETWNDVMSLEEMQGELMTSTLAAAQKSADAAAASATAAKTSANNASNYSGNAFSYSYNASRSEQQASRSADDAYSYSNNAMNYRNDASAYASDASNYATSANSYMNSASTYAFNASSSASTAASSSKSAAASAKAAKEAAEGMADFRIRGYYAAAEALTAAVTGPEAGDAYGVGADAPYDIYVWDGVGSRWVNNGPLFGVRGKAMILQSSTDGSDKRFKITVDDSGTLSAAEITE